MNHHKLARELAVALRRRATVAAFTLKGLRLGLSRMAQGLQENEMPLDDGLVRKTSRGLTLSKLGATGQPETVTLNRQEAAALVAWLAQG